MIPIESLITFVMASVLLGLAPGPDNIYVLTQSALYGRKAGITITFGQCSGLLVHTTAVALGVAVLFQTSIVAFTLLKIVGAIYLLYLAWHAFRASSKQLQTGRGNELSGLALYRRGIIMNVTNPKVSIFFLAFLPQFAVPANGPMAQQIFVLGALFILMTLLVFGGIAMMAGSLGSWLGHSAKAQIVLNRIAGTVFASLALKLITVENDP